MYYIIYIDVYFFVNFLMNVLILRLLQWCKEGQSCCQREKKTGKIIFAAFLGGILSCLFIAIVPENTVFWLVFLMNLLFGWIMVRIVFADNSIRNQMYLVGQLVLLEILVNGIMNLVLIRVSHTYLEGSQKKPGLVSLAATGACVVLFLKEMFKGYKKEKQISSHLYTVKLCHHGKVVDAVALLDTGNHLREPVTGKAVVIIEMVTAKKLLGELETSNIMAFSKGDKYGFLPENPVKLIPFHSLGEQHGVMPGVVIEKMIVYKEQGEQICERVQIGIMEEQLSGEELYQVILHEAYME